MKSEYTPEQLKALMVMFSIVPMTANGTYICGCCGTSIKKRVATDVNLRGLFNVWISGSENVKEPVEEWDSLVIPDADSNVTLMWKPNL